MIWTARSTYAEPWNGAADGTGDHRRPERRGISSEFLGSHLLHRFIDTEVKGRPHCVAHAVEAEAGVQAAESVTLDDLLDGSKGAETGLVAQRWISGCIRGSLSTVGHQDRGLDNILGQFEGAYISD